MPRTPAKAKQEQQRICLITGGGGFLGRHLAEGLHEKGCRVIIFDIRKTFEDERFIFITGDLTKLDEVVAAFKNVDTVFHVAAMQASAGNAALLERVNIGGTQNVIDACVQTGVKQLILTSSASVVVDGKDICNGDEDLPYPDSFLDHYTATKAASEKLVLAANGQGGVATIALRPHGIFGPRDVHFFPKLLIQSKKRHNFIIGDGRNVVDFTYVGNVVHGHLCAMEKLSLEANCAGKAYFITNDEPVNMWDFMCKAMALMGAHQKHHHLPASLIWWASRGMNTVWGWFKKQAPLTPYMVGILTTHHYFSSLRAHRDLGYYAQISVDDGMRMAAAHFVNEAAKKS
eukprot:TRINITY_DN111_c0_g2_i1.p1 TRINITY_DN111_c0_g2~~TRINITY_DN111_c0_g2_i1.p1  ORF type:complete len:345 (+),score=90.75 TRINITY_DN111_c0_g2_i1:27-1061(+)